MDLVYTWCGNRYWSQVLAASAFMTITLGSRSQTLNSCVKFLFLILELITSLPLDGFSLYLVW